jgi:RNA polymerase sigma-70 factor (ECF subfamily)
MDDFTSSDDRAGQFISLYNQEQRRIYALIRSMVFNRSDADDIFQETCTALWKSFGDFQPGTSFFAWAAQVTRHRVLAFGKKRQRDFLSFGDETLLAIADEVESQDKLFESRREALDKCLDKLSSRDRELLQNRYENSRSTVAMAAELNRPLETLYKSLQRIRHNLLKCIEQTLSVEGELQ